MSQKKKRSSRVKPGPQSIAENPEAQARAKRFAKNFVTALSKRGKTLSQLAEETGINLDILSRWKNQGRTRVSEDALLKVAESLGFEPHTIWDEEPAWVELHQSPPHLGVLSIHAKSSVVDTWREEIRCKLETLLQLPDANWIARAVELAYEDAKTKHGL